MSKKIGKNTKPGKKPEKKNSGGTITGGSSQKMKLDLTFKIEGTVEVTGQGKIDLGSVKAGISDMVRSVL